MLESPFAFHLECGSALQSFLASGCAQADRSATHHHHIFQLSTMAVLLQSFMANGQARVECIASETHHCFNLKWGRCIAVFHGQCPGMQCS